MPPPDAPKSGVDPLAAMLDDLLERRYFVADGQGRVSRWSGGGEDLFGWREEEVAGRSAFAPPLAWAGEGVERWKAYFERPQGVRPPAHAAMTMLCRAGHGQPVEMCAVPVPLVLGYEFTMLVADLAVGGPGSQSQERLRQVHSLATDAIAAALREDAEPVDSVAGLLVGFHGTAAPLALGDEQAKHAARALTIEREDELDDESAVLPDALSSEDLAAAQSSLHAATKEVTKLRREVATLRGRLGEQERALYEARSQFEADMTAAGESLSEEAARRGRLESELAQALDRLAEASHERDEARARVRELEAAVAETDKLREDAVGELAATAADRDAVKDELAATAADRDAVKDELAATAADRDAVKDELAATAADRDAAKADLEATVADRDAVKDELAATAADRDAVKADLEAAIAAARGELEAAEAERAELEAKLEAVERERASVGAVADETEQERDRLRAEIEAAKADRDAVKAELESAVAAANAERAELEAKLEEAERQRADLEGRLQAVLSELSEAAHERDSAGVLAGETEHQREQLRAELAASMARCEELSGALEAKAAELEALPRQAELQAAKRDRDEARAALAAALSERDRAEGALTAASNERDEADAALREAEAERDSARRELAEAASESEAALKALAERESRAEDLARRLEEAQLAATERAAEVEAARQDAVEQRERVAAGFLATEALAAERARVSELEAHIAGLRADLDRALENAAEKERAGMERQRADRLASDHDNTAIPRPVLNGAAIPRPGLDDVAIPRAYIGLDGRFTAINDGFSMLVGYTESEFSVAYWPPVVDADNRDDLRRLTARIVSGELDSAHVDTVYMSARGTLVPVVGTLRLDPDGGQLVLDAEPLQVAVA